MMFIYEIFDFLDFEHAYDAFYNLNKCFQTLLIDLTIPININMLSMSKSDFQNYYTHIITPNKCRIKSLYLSNSFSIDLFFTQVHIASKFTRLERIIFDNIKSQNLIKIWKI